jgi:signal transduction histidine kinase
MNAQQEFIHEVFHALAQPITALHASLELARREGDEGLNQTLECCLERVDVLMEELAILREITALEEGSPLQAEEASALLGSCLDEMAPVAAEHGVELRLDAAPGTLACNAAMLRRALFLLLDAMIAAAKPGGGIALTVHPEEEGVRLELHPSPVDGQRFKLFRRLMQCAGATSVGCDLECAFALFRGSTDRQPS